MIGHENTGPISIWSIRNKRLLRFAATMFSAAALIFADQYRLAEARTDAPAPPKKCLYSGVSSENPSLRLCISPDNFSRDVCTIIEHYAKANDLPAPFFARLIWRESLFQPDAISPKGAEGIAQFMPGTAKLRGLSDSFNAVAALGKSAEYLSELKSRYGNLGFAAAAYNAGEAGLERFLEKDRLPYETRDYVLAITAYSVEDWRDNPPKSLNIELDKEKSFLDGCVALADTRRLRELVVADEAVWAPWGIQLSAHYPEIRGATLVHECREKIASADQQRKGGSCSGAQRQFRRQTPLRRPHRPADTCRSRSALRRYPQERRCLHRLQELTGRSLCLA
ncbi:hypothetical protein ACVI55_003036 [Sinorhizobium medicae]